MKYPNNNCLFCFSIICLFVWSATCFGQDKQDASGDLSSRRKAVEQRRFIQIPGPNPILKPGPKGAWDDHVLEAADAFEDAGKYYFYYHARGAGKGYRLGVASADHPLGPFKKHGNQPVLNLGPSGSWDDRHVACAMVLKEGDTYYMWYSGLGSGPKGKRWTIGLATAKHPLGPWKKHEGNPVLVDFGYVGGMVKKDGKYLLYSAHPISFPGYHDDYSPLAVATAEKPEGPYVKYSGNPLMVKGKPGDWDGGGISEAEVLYHDGMFHMFYGATEKSTGPRVESVGYAYSFDGFKWFKHDKNPVVARQANPNAAALSEVHTIIEPPFIYLYYTLRYIGKGMGVEHLGIQVMATQSPFGLDLPVLNLKSLDAGKTTSLDDSPPISLAQIKKAALTLECAYSKQAKRPIRLHVRASDDGIKYEAADLIQLDNKLIPGKTARKTLELDTKPRFIKVIIENMDKSQAVSAVKVTVSLKG